MAKKNSGKGKKQGSRPTEAELNEIRSLGGSAPSMPSVAPSVSSNAPTLSQRMIGLTAEIKKESDPERQIELRKELVRTQNSGERYNWENKSFSSELSEEEKVFTRTMNDFYGRVSRGKATGSDVPSALAEAGFEVLPSYHPIAKKILSDQQESLYEESKLYKDAERIGVSGRAIKGWPGETLKTGGMLVRGKEGIYRAPHVGTNINTAVGVGFNVPEDEYYAFSGSPDVKAHRVLAPQSFDLEGNMLSFGAVQHDSRGEDISKNYPESLPYRITQPMGGEEFLNLEIEHADNPSDRTRAAMETEEYKKLIERTTPEDRNSWIEEERERRRRNKQAADWAAQNPASAPAAPTAPASAPAPTPAQRGFFDPPDEEELRSQSPTPAPTPAPTPSPFSPQEQAELDGSLQREFEAMTPEEQASERRRLTSPPAPTSATPAPDEDEPYSFMNEPYEPYSFEDEDELRRQSPKSQGPNVIMDAEEEAELRSRNPRPNVVGEEDGGTGAEDGHIPAYLRPEQEEAQRKATAARELGERKARVEQAKKTDIPESDYEGRRTLESRSIPKKIGMGLVGGVGDLIVGTLAGALIGGTHAAMSYDPEKESDPYLKPFRIIGRATAALGGAVEGGTKGLATAAIAKMTQGVGSLFAGESAGESLTGSFIRGFRSLSGKAAAEEGIGGAAKGVSEGLEDIPYVAFARNKGIEKELRQKARRVKVLESTGTPEAMKKAEEAKKLLESARNRALSPAQRQSLSNNQFGLLVRDAPNIAAYGAGVLTAMPFATLGAAKNLHDTHVKEKFPGLFRKENIGFLDAEFYNSYAPKNMIQDTKAFLNGRIANAPAAALYNIGITTIGATTLFGMATAPFKAGFESSGLAGNANHPFNVIRNAQDPGATARAQMEADAANKVKMTRPNMIGLSDIDEAYFTNQSFRPTRGRHTPGKYNDDGNLVFALSALRRG